MCDALLVCMTILSNLIEDIVAGILVLLAVVIVGFIPVGLVLHMLGVI